MKNGLVEYPNGAKEWYIHGKLHRVDGPAIEYPNGYKKWYLNGELHREDGPAIDYVDGFKRWYLNGQFLGNQEPENWEDLVRLNQVEIIMEI